MTTDTKSASPVLLRPITRSPGTAQNVRPARGPDIVCPPETTCPHCRATVSLSQAAPLSTFPCPACGGSVFATGKLGGFLLTGHIGDGQMGTVYRATDESLGREVAIKFVRNSHAEDPESRERLRKEARAAGQLNHPRVAQVYALNFSNGHPYLVMELVSGRDFSQKLESEGRLDERTVLKMALDVADGLSALNREGLIHGDIKPGNIVLDREGHAKLVDFGLSGMKRQDSKGHLVGTPNYIAPELLRGAADTHRSDLYSLGATLYHLLVGHPPIEGEKTIDVLKARLLGQPVPFHKCAGHLSPPTRALLMRMLESAPVKRPADSDAVAAELREALAKLDNPEAAETGGSRRFETRRVDLPGARTSPAPTRRRAALAAGLVLAAGLLAAGKTGHLAIRFPGRPNLPSAPQKASPRLGPLADGPKSANPEPGVWQVVSGEPGLPAQADFTSENRLNWQCASLGEQALRGSTMQHSGTLIIQSTGTEMAKGHESYRFVWSKADGNFAFSARVQSIAENDPLAISGLLIKGADPTRGPGLFFGFLGNGDLFLQARKPQGKPVLVKRSGRPIPFPCSLRITRRGSTFEAALSGDGLTWAPFATYDLGLPRATAVGFVVCPNKPDTLATAKFAGIRLLTPPLGAAPQTNAVPATAAQDVRPRAPLRNRT